MRPAWYLPCTLLISLSGNPQTSKVEVSRPCAKRASEPAPGVEAATAQDPDARNPPQENSQGQSTAGQNTGGQNSPAQDGLEAQNAEVEKKIVPLSEEPHYQVLLRNDFVHVYGLSVPPRDATLIHRHNLPYVAVNLAATDVENDVVGKPKARVSLQADQVTYSPGGFAHAILTDSGLAFRNVTIALPKPQGAARNLCKQIVAGPLGCPKPSSQEQTVAATDVSPTEKQKGKPGIRRAATEISDDDDPYFETDEIRVDVVKVSGGRDYQEEMPKENALLIAMTNANLDVNLGGEHISFLHEGDVVWLPVGIHRRVVDFLGTRSSFLVVSFKDSGNGTKQ